MSYRFPSRKHGYATLLLAVGLPVVAILIEVIAGWCASAFFDPLPSFWHLLLVVTVPIVNLMLWMLAREDDAHGPPWLAVAAGVSVVVSMTYTLLLLPLLPISVIAIVFFGIGLLPFAPMLALILAVRWIGAIVWQGGLARFLALGVVIGITMTGLADAPATVVQLAVNRYAGSDDDRTSALGLMRTVGDRDLLLRIAHGDSGRVTGLVGAFATSWSSGLWSGGIDQSRDARELYYRLTGEPFNARPKPVTGLAARIDWFTGDRDLGGEAVGARVPGLSLATSRIDGSAAVADTLAYVEWTVEIANAADVQNEARFTLAMPEGAVASRATLWVDGTPREASVAGRAEVRAAYSKVVSARRDPLLVTTDGASHLLIQAFPIAPNATMRLRVGYTAPFVIAADGRRAQALPAIVERNFDVRPETRHHVWIDGDAPLWSTDTTLVGVGSALRGTLSDRDLLARRPTFTTSDLTGQTMRIGSVAGESTAPPLAIEQRIVRARGGATSVMIVLDGSAPMAPSGAALAAALDALPIGLSVGLAVAADTPVMIAPAPWASAQRAKFLAALDQMHFAGGQDDQATLATATALVARPGGRVVWIHGAQPIDFLRSRTAIEQVLARTTTLPQLIRYQSVPGRATTIQGEPYFETARMVTPGIDQTYDLRAILSGLAGAGWRIDYRRVDARSGTASAHIVRLAAARDLGAAAKSTGTARERQIALARRLNIITPVSGAVVLETDKDYRNNALPIPSAEDVPTIPEPETWALLAILAAFAAWQWRQRTSGILRAVRP